MARFVPAHQHAFVSFLAFVVFAAVIGWLVWSALHSGDDAARAVDAGSGVRAGP